MTPARPAFTKLATPSAAVRNDKKKVVRRRESWCQTLKRAGALQKSYFLLKKPIRSNMWTWGTASQKGSVKISIDSVKEVLSAQNQM